MINQFIQLSPEDVQDLKSIYSTTYARIDTTNFEMVMQIHFHQLSSWIKRFYPGSFPKALKTNSRIGNVINREYSVGLIEDIYNIKLQNLKEPIIDIGCGRNALLVNELLLLEKDDILGIDRFLNIINKKALEVSWFDFRFEKNTWNTVFANMSFSNNLLYAMKYKEGSICEYYLKYKEIIESLRVGGVFYYAPSLTCIEERLDARYSIERTEKEGISVTTLTVRD